MIDKVVRQKLCTNCGTCIPICPTRAISYQRRKNNFEMRVDRDKCNKCGLCLKVCPGLGVDFENLNKDIFGKDKNKRYDSNLGYFINCYLGYSKDKKLRFQCSSGGAVTSILIYLLKYKIIDGALVTTMDSREPLIAKSFIAYNEKDVIKAKGSKYTPVALNECLAEIIKSKNKKFAVVGLPCHIHGIRKFQQINPILKRKIIVCLGLMCGQGVNISGTRFILKQLKVKASEVKNIQYRGEGWPGYIKAIKKNGQIKITPYLEAFKTFTLGFFTPERCFLCTDLTNELADISFGDSWIPKLMKNNNGVNFIITRTQVGQELINKVKKDICYRPASPNLVIESKKIRLFFKKDSHQLLAIIARVLGFGTSGNNIKSRITPLSVFVIFTYLNSVLSNKYPDFFLKIPLFIWKLPLLTYRKSLNIYKKMIIKP